MLKALAPVDGSGHALRALRHIASRETTCRQPTENCLLNVQPPAACGMVRMFLSQRDLK